MVITRSHINEQISKGGKKMANGKFKAEKLLTKGYKKLLLSKEERAEKLRKFGKKKPKYVKDQKSKSGFDAFGTRKRELRKKTKEKNIDIILLILKYTTLNRFFKGLA